MRTTDPLRAELQPAPRRLAGSPPGRAERSCHPAAAGAAEPSGISKHPAAAGVRTPVAQVSGLTVTLSRQGRPVHALRGVDLVIGRGEVVGLVGESGSGKSVLGLTLLGLWGVGQAALGGSAVVQGTDMVSASAEQRRLVRRRHMGAVFQDPMTSLNPTMRIGRQVAEAAGSQAEALRLLDAAGVPDPRSRLHSYPHQLSGGLRQRVMIAMALAGEPALVVADEPTTALDVTVQAQILELLRGLRAELGTSFLFVTHDLGVASAVADRIVVLYGGRVAEVGPTGAVLGGPVHPYTAGLLRSRLTLTTPRDRPLSVLPGEPPDPRLAVGGCSFASRCGSAVPECHVSVPALADAGGGRAAACPVVVGAAEADERSGPVGAPVDSGAGGVHECLGRAPSAAAAVSGVPLAVSVEGVRKSFRGRAGWRSAPRVALAGVDLQVAEGEAVAIVGESGCGKSTLLRAIAGLSGVDQGSVVLGRGSRPQMVFQDAGASLTPWMTVGDMLDERLGRQRLTRQVRRDRIAGALATVGLPAEVATAKAAQLSGGQRQRVALARATIVTPEVLLCDEPTSALDVSLAAVVINLLAKLRAELGMAMLFVTHDLAVARLVADRMVVMREGMVVEQGGSDDVVHRPRHEYTRQLLAAVEEVH